jgi:hypothetical protein
MLNKAQKIRVEANFYLTRKHKQAILSLSKFNKRHFVANVC